MDVVKTNLLHGIVLPLSGTEISIPEAALKESIYLLLKASFRVVRVSRESM
jgi:hypothetical protein